MTPQISHLSALHVPTCDMYVKYTIATVSLNLDCSVFVHLDSVSCLERVEEVIAKEIDGRRSPSAQFSTYGLSPAIYH